MSLVSLQRDLTINHLLMQGSSWALGTITATVTSPAQYGSLAIVLAVFAAPGINLIVMLYAKNIGRVLIKLNVMSALVRIIGLIIAAIGIHLIFDGGIAFLKIHGLIKLM